MPGERRKGDIDREDACGEFYRTRQAEAGVVPSIGTGNGLGEDQQHAGRNRRGRGESDPRVLGPRRSADTGGPVATRDLKVGLAPLAIHELPMVLRGVLGPLFDQISPCETRKTAASS